MNNSEKYRPLSPLPLPQFLDLLLFPADGINKKIQHKPLSLFGMRGWGEGAAEVKKSRYPSQHMLCKIITLLLALLPILAHAATPELPTLPDITVGQIGDAPVSLPLQTLLLMTSITLLPSLLLVLTAFTRIMIVLSLLRQALGTGQAPSNQVLVGLALTLTILVMMPVWTQAWDTGFGPWLNQELDFRSAWTLGTAPIREFMFAQVRETDLMTFAGLAGHDTYPNHDAVPFHVLMSAFVTSELKTAFEIGFLIYIPFVIIDLVVSSVLMSMGMMMLSPMLVSAPFKILLFVLVDGWVLTVGTLAASFN